MIFTSTPASIRLVRYARRLGHDLGIVCCEQNAAGKYFITEMDGRPTPRWYSLGWTEAEARHLIERWEPAPKPEWN